MKKMVSLCCALLLAICALAVPASAFEPWKIYETNGGSLWFSKKADGSGVSLYESKNIAGDLVVPEKIDGLPVVELSYYSAPPGDSVWTCLSSNEELLSVSLPSTLVTLDRPEESAGGIFSDCNQLKEVIFQGDGPEIIPREAFGTAENLEQIVLPKKVKELGPLFCDSEHIQELVLDPQNPYLVKDSQGIIYNREMTKVVTALEGADSRTEVTLPETVTEIGEYAFVNNRKLETIHGLSHVTKVKYNAFANCDVMYPFWDTEGHWAKTDMDWAYEKGLVEGTSPIAYSPNASMTRGMFVTILFRNEDVNLSSDELQAIANDPFTDVNPFSWQYYSEPVYWARSKGIVNGLTKETFGPNVPVTREQLAVLLYRYAEFRGDVPEEGGDLSGFKDGASVSGYAKAAVEWAVKSGLLQGKGNGRLDPKGTATRAEVTAMLHRYLGDS